MLAQKVVFITSPIEELKFIVKTMWFTFQELQKHLGIKGRQTIYNYEKKGYLDGFIEKIEGTKYIYMRKIKGKTVVQQLRKHVFTIDLKDFDADKYLESLKFY